MLYVLQTGTGTAYKRKWLEVQVCMYNTYMGRGTDTDEICIWVVFQVQVQLIYVYEYRGAV